MRIRMRDLAAGPRGTFRPGKEYEVDAAFGKELVKAGHAEEVAKSTARPVKETADAQPGGERATGDGQ